MSENILVLNLDDHGERLKLMAHVGTLRGLCEVGIKPVKKTRSLNANRFYFQCVVSPFLHYLREMEGDPSIDKEQAHLMLKCAVLGTKPVTIPGTGEVIEMPPRTFNMKSDEFAQYIEKAIKWLAEFAEITVIPSELFYETKG
jgi:hypothetical protein